MNVNSVSSIVFRISYFYTYLHYNYTTLYDYNNESSKKYDTAVMLCKLRISFFV